MVVFPEHDRPVSQMIIKHSPFNYFRLPLSDPWRCAPTYVWPSSSGGNIRLIS